MSCRDQTGICLTLLVNTLSPILLIRLSPQTAVCDERGTCSADCTSERTEQRGNASVQPPSVVRVGSYDASRRPPLNSPRDAARGKTDGAVLPSKAAATAGVSAARQALDLKRANPHQGPTGHVGPAVIVDCLAVAVGGVSAGALHRNIGEGADQEGATRLSSMLGRRDRRVKGRDHCDAGCSGGYVALGEGGRGAPHGAVFGYCADAHRGRPFAEA